ncbi:MAG: Hpt domain-containing protein [Planctomycetaceae bacterium]|nr:Hpt domain-containing protein [Planctomycetaceae bacterium]
MADQQPVFNLRTALARLGGDERLFRDLAGIFFEDYPGLLDQLRASCAAADAEQVTRRAHRLKGLVGHFDALAAHGTAHDLEARGRAGPLQGTADAIETLAEQLRELEQQLREHCAKS